MNRYRELVESWREGIAAPDDEVLANEIAKAPASSEALAARGTLSAALIDSLLDSAQPMYVCDEGGELVYANTPYRNLLALSSARSGARATSLETPGSVHAELARARQAIERVATVTIGNATRHYRARHVPLLGRDGGFAGSYGIYTDVTESQANQRQKVRAIEHSDLLIRSIADWVWETDAELILTEASRGISGVTGLPPEMLVGVNLRELGSFEESKLGRRSADDIFARRVPFRNLLYRMTDTEGRARFFRLTGMPFFEEPDQGFAGYHGTATEATAQIEAEAAAAESRRQLERTMATLVERNKELGAANESAVAATQSKSKFLAMMSHELRTPLNAIIGFSELAALQMFGPLQDPYLGYSKDVLTAAQHLLGVINDVLDVAKIESNALTVIAEPVALGGVLADAKSFVALQSEKKDVDIDAVATETDVTLIADPVRLRQVMINLLSNAVKFTEPGGRVGVSIDRKVPGTVDVTVWDTGIGIPSDKQDQVFESFQQIGQDIEHRPHEGSGLGLTISRHLVHLMGGEIWLESEPGKGSRFTIRLPLANGDPAPGAEVPATGDDAPR